MSDLLKQNAGLLLKKAYYGLLRDVSDAQQKLAEAHRLRELFSFNAIPPGRMNTTRTLTEANDNMERHLRFYQNSIDEKMPLLFELERLFIGEGVLEMEAFADFIRDRVKQEKKKKKSKRGK